MLATRLDKLMKDSGVTSTMLTDDAGVPNGRISEWRNGKRLPTAENLIKLADYFDVSVDYLLGRTDKQEVNK